MNPLSNKRSLKHEKFKERPGRSLDHLLVGINV